MHHPVVDLAVEMINIPSVSGSERAMAEFLKAYLEARGWEVVLQPVAGDRANVYAHRPGKTPNFLFNSHIDTVPPFIPASIANHQIHGRGACDTKSLIAAQLLAAQALVEAGRQDIGLLYVVGEEVDHIGMIKANDLGLNPKFLLVAEPTESKLIRRQKGILKVKLSCEGIAAHSGYPHTGKSAIDPLLDVLTSLRAVSWPNDAVLGATTLNIGVIHGGRAANVVPDHAHAELLFRVVTSYEAIRETMEQTVAGRATIEVVAANNPTELTTLEGYPTEVIAFNTDIPYFQFDGKALLWGAGSILHAHTPAEHIGINDLIAAVSTYQTLALQCLGQVPSQVAR